MRVVLQHTRGLWSGVCQILGTTDQVKKDMQVAELPDHIANIDFGDRTNGASLVKVTRSYILYRELIIPEGLQAFNPEQR